MIEILSNFLPPLFGFIVGIYNIYHQRKTIHNSKMIILSAIGIVISLCLTVIMVLGFALEL